MSRIEALADTLSPGWRSKDGTRLQRMIAYEAAMRALVALEEAWDNIVELDRRMEREILVLTCQVAGVADAIRRGGGF
jgi:hypothetical protein